MRADYICPHCKATITAPPSLEGETAPCPRCRAEVNGWRRTARPAIPTPAPPPVPKPARSSATMSAAAAKARPTPDKAPAAETAGGLRTHHWIGLAFGACALSAIAFAIGYTFNGGKGSPRTGEPDLASSSSASPSIPPATPPTPTPTPSPVPKSDHPASTPTPAVVSAKPKEPPVAPMPMTSPMTSPMGPPVAPAPMVAPAPAMPPAAPLPRDIGSEIRRTAEELAATSDSAARVKCLERLSTYGADARLASEAIIAAMRDMDEAVRDAASEAFEKVDPKLYPHVFTLIRGEKKGEAMIALAKLGDQAKAAIPLLLDYHMHPELWYNRNEIHFRDPFGPADQHHYYDLFPVLAEIAPHDERFAAAVLKSISDQEDTDEKRRGEKKLESRRTNIGRLYDYYPRLFGLAQLNIIKATDEEKVKALVEALRDGQHVIEVVKALTSFGRDAAPALPALKKLKLSDKDEIREAATAAVKAIE